MAQKFTLNINIGNAAMQNSRDLAYALHKLGRKFDIENPNLADSNSGIILDDNGNTIGSWTYE